MSSRTRNAVKWRDLLASDRKRGDSSSQKLLGMTWEWGTPLPADFAPLGLVRRFVEMFLKAGIPPRVGRNDGRRRRAGTTTLPSDAYASSTSP